MRSIGFIILAGIILGVITGCLTGKKAVSSPQVFIASSGLELPYQIYFPKSDVKNKLPLFIWLHGMGERGNDNINQLKHVVPFVISDSVQRKFPCIVAAPQCPDDDYWASLNSKDWEKGRQADATRPMKAVMEWIAELAKDPRVDPSRIYVGGLSMGGYGTLDLISRKPEWFAAAIPVCGGIDVSRATTFKNVPLWIFHGAKDPVVPVKLSRDLVKALEQAGAKPIYTEYPEGGHDVWNAAIREKGLMEWMFSQTL
ncbi:MAG TPA: prolyl oligopeptidase family serine peptidase [Saprospiraceae bacterium]|nr:prolyl oligopeptidase family serine peptidase [Saprospiraceae bacterium]